MRFTISQNETWRVFLKTYLLCKQHYRWKLGIKYHFRFDSCKSLVVSYVDEIFEKYIYSHKHADFLNLLKDCQQKRLVLCFETAIVETSQKGYLCFSMILKNVEIRNTTNPPTSLFNFSESAIAFMLLSF